MLKRLLVMVGDGGVLRISPYFPARWRSHRRLNRVMMRGQYSEVHPRANQSEGESVKNNRLLLATIAPILLTGIPLAFAAPATNSVPSVIQVNNTEKLKKFMHGCWRGGYDYGIVVGNEKKYHSIIFCIQKSRRVLFSVVENRDGFDGETRWSVKRGKLQLFDKQCEIKFLNQRQVFIEHCIEPARTYERKCDIPPVNHAFCKAQ